MMHRGRIAACGCGNLPITLHQMYPGVIGIRQLARCFRNRLQRAIDIRRMIVDTLRNPRGHIMSAGSSRIRKAGLSRQAGRQDRTGKRSDGTGMSDS
jgi:hypothetical protein